MTNTGLIYDIGAHHSDDTAWYLQQGCRVVAVEATPPLAKKLQEQFSREIANQRKMVPDYLTAPFGEALTGKWFDYDIARQYIQRHFNDYFAHTINKQLIFWVDVHARL